MFFLCPASVWCSGVSLLGTLCLAGHLAPAEFEISFESLTLKSFQFIFLHISDMSSEVCVCVCVNLGFVNWIMNTIVYIYISLCHLNFSGFYGAHVGSSPLRQRQASDSGCGVRKMAHLLSTLDALVKDPSSAPNTHVR